MCEINPIISRNPQKDRKNQSSSKLVGIYVSIFGREDITIPTGPIYFIEVSDNNQVIPL